MFELWAKAPWRHYASAFRDSLNMWAVWLPGSHIEVGDYGVLERYCFQRKGNISEFIDVPPKQVREKDIDIALQLGRFGQLKGAISGEAKHTLGPLASVELDVSATKGIFLRVEGLTKTEFITPIPIQRRLVEAIRDQGFFWKKEWLLVHEVFLADSFAVLATRGKKSSLLVRGSVEALQELGVGKAKSGGSLGVAGATDLNILGAKGPIAIGLMRVEIAGFKGGEYKLMPDNAVRLSAFRPQDVRFPSDEETG